MKNINLALSGGGIKGVAHIGVLKYLEENRYKLNSISGCSSGSIMAVLIALGYNSEQIYKMVKYYINIVNRNRFNINMQSLFRINKRMGLNNGNIIENIMNNILKEKDVYNISQIRIPIYIPAVDITNGKLIYFTNDINKIKKRYSNEIEYITDIKISEAIRASCSYPGIFSPKKIGNKLLIDGGVRENIAITPLLDNKYDTLAVMFSNTKKREINNIFDVITNSFEILSYDNTYESAKLADKVIEIKLDNVKLLDFSKIDYLYKEGYIQAKQNRRCQ